ncbi:MAG: alpha/beta hydrolase [Aestuariivita sp.]|uniref:alpha/beta fold hydrolase n=1 Tax=Aestuariivita sp. TaxID=1872407 RepID=UPI003BB167C7
MREPIHRYVPGQPRLSFDRLGDGPPVVFLHGIGGNRFQWRNQLEAFGNRFTAISWDARGYGASDDYKGELSFVDFSADLLRLLDHLNVDKAHLVGLSMGARILLDFAPDNLSRIATLTLCDFFYGFDESLTDEKREEFITLRQKPLLEGKTLTDLAPALVASLLAPNPPAAVRQRLITSIEALHVDSYLKTLAATLRYNRSAALSRLTLPVQMIYGALDRLTPPSIGEGALGKLPDGRLAVIPGAGHLSNIEDPAAFNDILAGFLKDHRDSACWRG